MAKQNVSFGERHLEKFVIAVAGTVLAAMAFLYVIQDPYSVEVSGETLGPGAFYPVLDDKATQALNSLKNASPPEVPDWKPPTPTNQRTSTDLPVVFAPINPPVPKLDGGIELGVKLDLASILPPGKPALTTGRALASIPEPEIRFVGEKQAAPAANSSTPEPGDCHWVNVFATVSRKAQQEVFIKAKYAVDRQLLIVSNIEAERQRLLPGGEWGAPEKVTQRFSRVMYNVKPTMDVVREGGQPIVDPEQVKAIQQFMQDAAKDQREILRPTFQSALPPESQLEWTVPAAMPDGTKFDWVNEWGVTVPAEGQPAEGAAPPRFDYRKAKAEIDDLVRQEKFIEADAKVQEALKNKETLPPPQLKELEALTQNLQPKIKQQTDRIEAERLRRQQIEASTLGPDLDLLWVTDLAAKPGEMYRYRVRIVAVNPHAGQLRKMKNPEDGAKVVLAGEWSEWSDPVMPKPAKYLFCTGVDPQGVKVELNQWAAGVWDKTNQVVNLGQPMTFQDKLKEFAYDAVLVALDPAVRFEERNADKRGIRYREPRETAAIVFVRSDGEVEEHVVLADVTQRRELTNTEFSPKKEVQPREAAPNRMQDPRPGPRGGRGREEP